MSRSPASSRPPFLRRALLLPRRIHATRQARDRARHQFRRIEMPRGLDERLLRTLTDSFFRRKYDHGGDLTPILDYKVACPNRETCFDLYWEIFIQHDYLFTALHDDPVIIDCGSNIGMSVLYFKYFYPGARITAFEPDPEAFRYLARNVELNELSGVTLENKAVWSEAGPVTLFQESWSPGSPRSSIVRQGKALTPHAVEAVTLSDQIEGEVDFLKLDVEGAEHAVLDDLAKTKKLRAIDQMVVEYHHQDDRGTTQERLSSFLGVLEEHGFGYSLETWRQKRPLRRSAYQDVLIYAYRKQTDDEASEEVMRA